MRVNLALQCATMGTHIMSVRMALQAKKGAITRKLGELAPTIFALLQRDPAERMALEEARTCWANILRNELAR